VLTRAFACGTPVVASDIDGYREVVTPETAVSVPPGDADALVGAVESLLADEPRRVAMGEAARRRAEEHFAWPDIARRLEAIYERLLTRPASRPEESVAA
jgi:glycosyltransferase involved in cell wall biosynthesis